MDEKRRPLFGIRDLFWLVCVAIVLAVWGWDRRRLATCIEALNPPAIALPMAPGTTGLMPGGTGVPLGGAIDPFAPLTNGP